MTPGAGATSDTVGLIDALVRNGARDAMLAHRVDALGDGRFTCTGEMFRGTTTNLGPMVLLAVEDEDSDVPVIVGSSRFQCVDQAILRAVGAR